MYPVIRGPSGEPRSGLTREYRVLLVNEDYIITDVVVRVPYYDNTIKEPKTLFSSCEAPYIGTDPARMHRVRVQGFRCLGLIWLTKSPHSVQ